jgi:hypothetical protein
MKVMITAENAELAQSNSAQENWATREETIMALDRPCPGVTGPAAAQRTRAHLRGNGYSCRPQPTTERKLGGPAGAAVTTTAHAATTELHEDGDEFNAAEIGAIAHLYRG